MAKKRMFSIDIVGSDAFLDMSASAQSLYIQLNMRADDDGLISSVKRIVPYVGCTMDDLEELLFNRFILDLGDGIYAIKHWRINNTINKDRYTPTTYVDKKRKLKIKQNKAYTLCYENVVKNITNNTENGNTDKNSIDKNSIDKNNNICASDDTRNFVDELEINELPFYEEQDDDPITEKVKVEKFEEETETPKEIETFYEELWKLYPIKKGKGQVSLTKKKKLYRIGLEELSRCITRYVDEYGDKDRQFMMHGSTFLNSGYVDYLDENWNSQNDTNLVPRSHENEVNDKSTDDEPPIDLWSNL